MAQEKLTHKKLKDRIIQFHVLKNHLPYNAQSAIDWADKIGYRWTWIDAFPFIKIMNYRALKYALEYAIDYYKLRLYKWWHWNMMHRIADRIMGLKYKLTWTKTSNKRNRFSQFLARGVGGFYKMWRKVWFGW